MQIKLSAKQMETLLKTVGAKLDENRDGDLFYLYLRLLLQAKEEGIDIAGVEV